MEYSLLIAHQRSGRDGQGAEVERLIESLGQWIEIQPSIYILWTRIGPQDVRERIRQVLDDGDDLAVAQIDEDLAKRFGMTGSAPPRAAVRMPASAGLH